MNLTEENDYLAQENRRLREMLEEARRDIDELRARLRDAEEQLVRRP